MRTWHGRREHWWRTSPSAAVHAGAVVEEGVESRGKAYVGHEMKKKRIVIGLSMVGLMWILTLGLHCSRHVRAYCQGHDTYDQPEVYVFMDPVYDVVGIPWVCTQHRDVLPYPLEIAVTVDDRVPGEGAVIESMEIQFDNGETGTIVRPDYPRGGPLGAFEPVESDKKPGRTFKRARIGIPNAIWRRGSFQMVIKGYIYGQKKVSFERHLRMDYSREAALYSGWTLLAGASC